MEKDETRPVRTSAQGGLQARRLQRLHLPSERALKRLPSGGGHEAALPTEIRPPARGGLREIERRLVLRVEHQPAERQLRSLLSTSQARSVRPGLHDEGMRFKFR